MDNHPDFDNCRYTLPGILHFLQHEWSQFELERAQWESEKAELQATIAFLQGERRGQENLKRDLIRRIKMLEFALKKERIKVTQMKGEDGGNIPNPPELDGNDSPTDEIPPEMAGNQEGLGDLWSGGRQLLRQYLQEVGFTDTILDARSARLRALLGNSAPNDDDDDDNENEHDKMAGTYGAFNDSGGVAVLDELPLKDDDIQDAMADFNFLQSENASDWNPNTQVIDKKKEELILERKRKPRPPRNNSPPRGSQESGGIFNQLQGQLNNNDNDSENKEIGEEENEEELELGVLAGLTINNEADPLGLSDNSQFRRSWTHKYTLRSHLDGVRCVQFHPVEPLLVSASEDKVVKVWNLNKTVAGKKTQTADIDPIMNYRGHEGPVLSVVFGENEIYSSGLDGLIFGWPMPKLDADLYDPFDPEILGRKFEGHTDAVWNLDFLRAPEPKLVSTGADGKIIIWDLATGTPAMTITAESLEMPDLGTPIDARWSSENNKLVAIWRGDKITTIDVSTGKIVLLLDECVDANAVCTHPLVPIAVTAHEDKHIRMWDLSSGILVHTCSAHADAVSTVAIDKSGSYLLTGGHDSSIRLWNIDTKVCVQEMTAHRPKNDEAVHFATFHINKGYVASAGADGLVKIFV